MTRDEIVRMAREAGVFTPDGYCVTVSVGVAERFAELIAAAEREACAQEIERILSFVVQDTPPHSFLTAAAAVIRARGRNEQA